MKILHLVSGSSKSGAFKGAYLLHDYLIKEGINSKILNNSKIDDLKKLNNVHTINKNLLTNIKLNFFSILDRFPKIFFLKRKNTSFSNNFFGVDFLSNKLFLDADIVHLHWINKSFLDISSLKKFNKPIVWTLRDMWAFTGGCHYTLGCKKFMTNCGKCPQLGSGLNYDLSTYFFNKKKVLKNINIKFCTISQWLADSAKKSLILKSKKIINMNNHIDVKNFYPVSKEKCKKSLNIFSKKKIILFGAENIEAKYKGFDKFLKSLDYIDKKNYLILIFGKMWDFSAIKNKNIEFKYIGYVDNKNKLRQIYNCADVFAISSLQDAFPKTFAEAMLCNVPVVAFDQTSISGVNLHKKTGYNAKNSHPKDFAKGIKFVTNNKLFKKNPRKLILKKYNPKTITKNYIKLYKKILNEKK